MNSNSNFNKISNTNIPSLLNVATIFSKHSKLFLKTNGGPVVINKSLLQDSKASLEIYSKIENSAPGVIFYSENDSNDIYTLTIGRTDNNEIFIDSYNALNLSQGSLTLMPSGGSLILPKKLVQNNKCLITYSNSNSGVITKQITGDYNYKDVNFQNDIANPDKYYIYDPENFVSTESIFRPGLSGFYKIKTKIRLNSTTNGTITNIAICLPDNTIIFENFYTKFGTGYHIASISGLFKIENNDLTNSNKNGFKIRCSADSNAGILYIQYFDIQIEYLGF